MPPRSTLYRLTPIGMGTARRESLASYVCRLAHQHCFTPQQLAQAFVLPLINSARGKVKNARQCNSAWQESSFCGVGAVADSWTQCLEELTMAPGLRGLTFLSLQDAVSPVGLMARRKRWCPQCLLETSEVGAPYGQLIWELDCVEACSIHETRLVSRCSCAAGVRQSRFETKFLPHICKSCGQFLSEASSLAERATDREIAIARVVGRWLDSDVFDNQIQRNYLSKFITEATIRCADGKAAWLANILGVGKSLLHGWMHGTNLTEFPRIVSIALRLDCDIADIFQANPERLRPMEIPPAPYKRGVHPRRSDGSALDRKLEELLNQSESISVAEAAKLLGKSKRTLYLHSGELTKRLSARHQAVRDQQLASALADKKQLIRDGVRSMLAEGVTPTRRHFMERLGKRVPLFSQKDKALFKEILAEESVTDTPHPRKDDSADHNLSHRAKEP
ncbi:putative TniQ protein [Burkholderia multivorans]